MAYVIIVPRSWVSETHIGEHRPTCDVIEEYNAPRSTGLLSACGSPIYSVRDTVPIGFHGRDT